MFGASNMRTNVPYCFIALISLLTCSVAATEIVKVAKEQRKLYPRDDYIVSLLELALANQPYQLQHVPVHPHQQRTLLKLSQGDVDIHWGMTSPDREAIATAIPIPIFKGLIGKRIALIKDDRQSDFTAIDSDKLKQFTAVQGHDWPDTKILAQNGYRVKAFAHYKAMFTLVSRGQVDYFPRSVIEIQDELLEFKPLGLAIETAHLINYPAAFYFFVNKEKTALANALQAGLTEMIADGRFDKLFDDYFAEGLSQLNLAKREIHYLENDYFTNTALLQNKALWYKK